MRNIIKVICILAMTGCINNKEIGYKTKVIDEELHSLSLAGNAKELQMKLREMRDIKKEVNEADEDEETLLYIASEKGHTEVVELLLKSGADKEKSNINGYTPLYIASQNGHTEVVKTLLEAEVDKDKAPDNGATPLYIASQNGHVEVVKVLLEAGADKNKAPANGATPIYIASFNGRQEVVEVLLKAGASKNKAMTNGSTPLHIASKFGRVEVIEMLLSYGAKVTVNCLRVAKTREIEQLLKNPPQQTKWPTSKKEDIEEKESKFKGEVTQEDSSEYGMNLREREDVSKGEEAKPTTNKHVRLRREDITIGKEIGRGNYGAVVLGHYADSAGIGEICVIKRAHNKEGEEELVKEGEMMRGLHHENIINMMEMYEKPTWLVVEYMKDGSLKSFLNTRRGNEDPLSTKMANNYAQQVALGMEYLESQGVVHRDLAARNVLKDGDLLKVSDFGLSRALPEDGDYYKASSDQALPARWMSLEAIEENKFTHKSDVWSYGVVLWEMMSLGRKPYEDISNLAMVLKHLNKGKRLVMEEGWEKKYPILIRNAEMCWAEEPEDRQSFEGIASSFK